MIVRTNVHTFDWDEGNRAKCQKHGLSISDVEYALIHGAKVAPDIDHSQDEQRFLAIGRVVSGRPVFIVFCWRGSAIRPISARYMHAREVARYETSTQDDN